jgi:hypothetical protein
MRRSFDTEATVDVRVEYDYIHGTPDAVSHLDGQPIPGDPPEVTNQRAYTMTTYKALEQALDDARARGRTEPYDMVEINLWPALSRPAANQITEDAHEDALL